MVPSNRPSDQDRKYEHGLEPMFATMLHASVSLVQPH